MITSGEIAFNGVQILQLADKGVYQGQIAYDPNGVGQTLYTGDLTISGTTVTRATGSFTDDGFLAGTQIKIGSLGTFTILSVSDSTLTLRPLHCLRRSMTDSRQRGTRAAAVRGRSRPLRRAVCRCRAVP